jgi:hypothetical protein
MAESEDLENLTRRLSGLEALVAMLLIADAPFGDSEIDELFHLLRRDQPFPDDLYIVLRRLVARRELSPRGEKSDRHSKEIEHLLRANEGHALQRRRFATSMCIMDYPNYSLLNGLDRSAKAEMPFKLLFPG